VQALWLRAVRAADARGLVPGNRAALTPGEVAAEASLRGEHRLAELVNRWYYPSSYGRVPGTLSDDDAARIVATLEAENAITKAAEARAPAVKKPRAPTPINCDLCGSPILTEL